MPPADALDRHSPRRWAAISFTGAKPSLNTLSSLQAEENREGLARDRQQPASPESSIPSPTRAALQTMLGPRRGLLVTVGDDSSTAAKLTQAALQAMVETREGLARDYQHPQPAWSALREPSYGAGVLHFHSSTHATWEWHRNQDNTFEVGDSVQLIRNTTCKSPFPFSSLSGRHAGPVQVA